MYTHIYIYIYIHRERERERDRYVQIICTYIYIYMYTYIYIYDRERERDVECINLASVASTCAAFTYQSCTVRQSSFDMSEGGGGGILCGSSLWLGDWG